jgi:hypothetical protein
MYPRAADHRRELIAKQEFSDAIPVAKKQSRCGEVERIAAPGMHGFERTGIVIRRIAQFD